MQPEDLVGQTLGHYRMKKQIGYGGMATVFLAQDIHLSREIALKVFWPRPGDTQSFLSRFLREARVLAQLDHPHILPIYDYGEEGNRAFLVTPYMSGGSLKDLLLERKALPPSEAVQFISQVLSALQYAHDRGVIHRDIKPGNLLLKNDGKLVLADFGLVKVVESYGPGESPLHSLTDTGQSLIGTPEYMAPEQIEGKVTAASDIYALGVVLYEMVTGVRPFTGDNLLNVLMQHIQEQPRLPREINPYISVQLEATILRALEKDQRKRFASPLAFQQALARSSGAQSVRSVYPGRATSESPGLDLAPHVERMRDNGGYPHAGFQLNLSAPASPLPDAYVQPPPGAQFPPNNAIQPPLLLPAPQGERNAGMVFQAPQPRVQSPVEPPAPTVPPARRKRLPVALLLILFVLLVGLVGSLFLTPVGALLGLRNPATPAPVGGTTTVTTGTPGTRFGTTPPPVSTVQPMGTTLTSCPTAGTARAAVIVPFAGGSSPAIVFLGNERDANGPTLGSIKIYNTVTGKTDSLARLKKATVDEAQISNDGQWVLFAATIAGQSQLRLVRVDGKGLQTLLCAPTGMTIKGSELSIDQEHVIFDEFPASGEPTMYLLDTRTGTLQVEFAPPVSGPALLPRTWLDNNRVLMVSVIPGSTATPTGLSVLNINNGASQSFSSIPTVFTPSQPVWDCDTSYDGNSLFITQAQPAQPEGSSTITRQPVSGLSSTPVLISSDLAFATVRVIDADSSYLLAVASDATQTNPSGDPQHDGLYLISAAKSTTQLLVGTPAGDSLNLNLYSQYFWSNISRDGDTYAVETVNTSTRATMLSYGLLSGGASTVFASTPGMAVAMIGWTTA